MESYAFGARGFGLELLEDRISLRSLQRNVSHTFVSMCGEAFMVVALAKEQPQLPQAQDGLLQEEPQNEEVKGRLDDRVRIPRELCVGSGEGFHRQQHNSAIC